MRILIYGINFAPELTGIGKYSGELAAMLAEHGHEVRVVTVPPYYPQWRVASGYSAWRYQNEQIGQVSVLRCPLWVPRSPRGLTRLLHLASFALSSIPAMLRQVLWRPDVVLLIVPTLFCAPAAWLVARMSGARAWLHIQDFELDAAIALGLLKSQLLQRLAQRFESFWLLRFDKVSTISDAMLARLKEKNVEPRRCMLFPNWVDTRSIYPLQNPSSFRAELGISDQVVVALYAGNMGEKQGLEIIINAAQLLSVDLNIVFVIAGAGAARMRLEQMAQGMTNVRWLPLQPVDRMNDLLNLADIHLLPQQAGAADLVMPSKLTGMFASGRPVVATAAPDTQLAKVVTGRGEVTPPGDTAKYGAIIRDLSSDLAKRHRYGVNAREYAVQHLDYSAVVSRFEHDLAEVVKQTKSGLS